MLIIRDVQLQAFLAADDDELVRVVSNAVRDANPARVKGYSDEKMNKMVRIAISRARERGLTKAEYIAAFAAIMFEVSPLFDQQEAMSAVLEDANFTPEQRLFQLFERVPDEAWAEAERSYDESVWFDTGN